MSISSSIPRSSWGRRYGSAWVALGALISGLTLSSAAFAQADPPPPDAAVQAPTVAPPSPATTGQETKHEGATREGLPAEAEPPSPIGSPGLEATTRPGDAKRRKKDPAPKVKYESAEAEIKAKLNRRGTITLRDATLNQALFYIRQQWDVSLVFGNELQGDVNAVFTDQPLYEILDTLLYTRGYGYRTVGNSLAIMKREDIKGMDPRFETVTIPIQYGEAGEIESTIQQFGILSPNGKMIPISTAKAIMVMDYPDQITKVKEFIATLEDRFRKVAEEKKQAEQLARAQTEGGRVPTGGSDTSSGSPAENLLAPVPSLEYGMYRVNHVKAKDLEPSINEVLSSEGKMHAIDTESRIFVVDYPDRLRKIQQVIEQLDVARPQVRIWALIYDASLDDVKRIGINWNSAVKGRNLTAAGTAQDQLNLGSLTNAPTPGAPNGAFTLMSLNTNLDVTSVVNALNNSKNSRLLANPNVIVMDKEKAKMSIVTEIPYQQLTQGGNSGGPIGTTAFREAGVSLEVTPSIADNGWIHMQVKPTFSLLTGFTQQTNQPIIDKRETETTVWVPSGETFVIGGLRQRQANHEGTGIPILQNMRFGIGYLFRSRQSTIRESELIVFLTPAIITPSSKLDCQEAQAFDYSRYMLSNIPSPPPPPLDQSYPASLPAADHPENVPPVPNAPRGGVAPIPDSDPGLNDPGFQVAPPVRLDESARLQRAPVQRPSIITVRRLPPIHGPLTPEPDYPSATSPYAPTTAPPGYAPPQIGAPSNPAASPYPAPPPSPTVIAPATAILPRQEGSGGSAPAKRPPPRTVWEAIQRR